MNIGTTCDGKFRPDLNESFEFRRDSNESFDFRRDSNESFELGF